MALVAEARDRIGDVIEPGDPLYDKLYSITDSPALPPISSFKIINNRRSPGYPVVKAVFNAGGEKTISLKPRNSMQKNTKHLRRKAMRDSVSEQMKEYMQKSHINECHICGSKNDLTVDHITPFRTLAEEFEQSVKYIPTRFTRDPQQHKMCFTNENQTWRSKWQDFHRRNAEFQILCRSCNSSLGGKSLL